MGRGGVYVAALYKAKSEARKGKFIIIIFFNEMRNEKAKCNFGKWPGQIYSGTRCGGDLAEWPFSGTRGRVSCPNDV